MKLPGCRSLLALLLTTVVLTGCDDDNPPIERPWRIVTSDAQGAVVADGTTIRGYHRDSRDPLWETEGHLTGAACASTCTTAFLTFADRPGLFLARSGSVVRQDLPGTDGELRVLLASDRSAVLLQTTDHTVRLLSWRQGKMVRLRKLGNGSPLWHGTPAKGTLFLLGESTAVAVTVRFRNGRVLHHLLPRLPHGVICYDASKTGTPALPEQAFRTLQHQLTHVSTCLAGPHSRWIGVSNYLTMSPENPNGNPSIAIAVADRKGALSWSRTFSGESFALSPEHGSDLLIANDRGMEVLETLTGKSVARFNDIADANYVGPRELVTINPLGEAQWVSY